MKSKPLSPVPAVRIRSFRQSPINPSGTFVLYWMTAFRRTRFNFSLQRAVELSNHLNKPLVVLEAIRCNGKWMCDRFHQFLLDGMLDNAAAFQKSKATYCGYVEMRANEAKGLVETFASHACVVVSDDFPCFFHPALFQRIVSRWKCALELVDSNTILPMRSADKTYTVAHSYRRYMQKEVYKGLPDFPMENPLAGLHGPKLDALPVELTTKWRVWENQMATKELKSISLASLAIDHSVPACDERGGPVEAGKVLTRFVEQRLGDYAEARNEPEKQGSSWLSPYLHFGHISPHEVFQRTATATNWTPEKLDKPNGKMTGFWNMGLNAEAFMDQLMTWREIGFNMCWRERNYDRFESLPTWAQKTLDDHATDIRPIVYELAQLEAAKTHDPLWNAAQIQLVREGRIHNYLRMLWGKKILQWTESPREALQVMIQLNNKYALDGRDPNSYSGIFWVLGRYDRAWGPERPIFGKIRYMTSESTQSKYRVKQYIKVHS